MTTEDNGLSSEGLAQRLEALERENAELRHENAELRGSGPHRGGGGRMIGKLTKRVRMAFASSGALSVVVLLALTAGVAVAAAFPTYLADTIKGTEQADTIDGLAGNDKIYGLGGNDTLKGNEGTDYIYGGQGSDRAEGGEANDFIDLGPGHDDEPIGGYGGPGNDTIKGGEGADDLVGEGGNDKLYGGPASETFSHTFDGGPGKNTYTGGAGPDAIFANTPEADGGAKEVIYAGAGNDRIETWDGVPDQIKCGGGVEIIVQGDTSDSVSDDCENVILSAYS